ncbi:hypothetical protein SAMN04488168_12818 [Bacillus sp. 491mf]|nr:MULTISPECIES: hypothetical protein [unclassified Bacillus (in: firmicutes)]SFD25988.1 hypothetical protein SAMN04488168_12818 [Bacillus sp. 491mf]
MQMFTTEVERTYRCTAIVVTGENIYEIRLGVPKDLPTSNNSTDVDL